MNAVASIFLVMELKRDLICRTSDALDCTRREEGETDDRSSSRARCLPRTPMILASFLHPRGDPLKSPVSDCRRNSSVRRQDCDSASGDGGSRRFAADASVIASAVATVKEERLVRVEES